MRKIILLSFFNLNVLISLGQQPVFFDSVHFFIRNKIKEIYIKDICNDTITWEGKITFNNKNKSTTFCGKFNKKEGLRGKRSGKWDCDSEVNLITYHVDTTILVWPWPTKFTFDKNQRLLKKSADMTNPDQGLTLDVTEYYYTDSINKRLKTILTKHPYNNLIDSTIFFYDKNKLFKTIETMNTKTKKIEIVTIYEYYPDGKIRRLCYENFKCDCVTEYSYKNNK